MSVTLFLIYNLIGVSIIHMYVWLRLGSCLSVYRCVWLATSDIIVGHVGAHAPCNQLPPDKAECRVGGKTSSVHGLPRTKGSGPGWARVQQGVKLHVHPASTVSCNKCLQRNGRSANELATRSWPRIQWVCQPP